MILKGEMSMLNVLHLQEFDVDKVCAELKLKRDASPQFFMRIPIVIDCIELDFETTSNESLLLFFSDLKNNLFDLGFIPIGVRSIPTENSDMLIESGWTVMQASTKIRQADRVAKHLSEKNEEEASGNNTVSVNLPEESQQAVSEKTPQDKKESLMIERPVRSGQQIYAAGGDLTVLAATSAGSEVMADGSIHVYGALRGRVLAGVKGNESARIFCQSLQAELIVIAGRYQLLDESDTTLIGKPAMIHLHGEKLIIEPLS